MGLVEALKSRKLHFWKWIYGASVDVGCIMFIRYASGPGIPPTLDLEEGEAFYDMRDKSETTNLLAAVRCCHNNACCTDFTFFQSSKLTCGLEIWRTIVKCIPKLRFESVSFLFFACFSIWFWGVHSNMCAPVAQVRTHENFVTIQFLYKDPEAFKTKKTHFVEIFKLWWMFLKFDCYWKNGKRLQT